MFMLCVSLYLKSLLNCTHYFVYYVRILNPYFLCDTSVLLMFSHIAEVLPAVRDYIRANMPPRGDY